MAFSKGRWLARMGAVLLLGACAFGQANVSQPAPVREPKDTGRQVVTLTADAVTPATSETLVTFTKLVGDTSTASVTTYPVSSGKTLRIQSLQLSCTQASTAANKCRIRLRTLVSGTCIATSPLVGTWELIAGSTLIANEGQGIQTIEWPDGLEFSGATRNICFSAIAVATTATVSITLTGYEY